MEGTAGFTPGLVHPKKSAIGQVQEKNVFDKPVSPNGTWGLKKEDIFHPILFPVLFPGRTFEVRTRPLVRGFFRPVLCFRNWLCEQIAHR